MNKIRRLFLCSFIWIYIAITPLFAYVSVFRCCRLKPDSIHCLSDVVLWYGHYSKDIIIIINSILLVYMLVSDFRIGVIVRFKNCIKLWLNQFVKIVCVSAVLSLYNLFCIMVLGLTKVQLKCNWGSKESFAYARWGRFYEKYPSTMHVIFLFVITIFLSTLAAGMVITMFWWLFENPLIGFVLNSVLVIAEIGNWRYIRVYYGIVDIEPFSVYSGAFSMEIIKYPFIYFPIVILLTIIIMNKKDYLRFK